jgi:hypothetical protein
MFNRSAVAKEAHRVARIFAGDWSFYLHRMLAEALPNIAGWMR